MESGSVMNTLAYVEMKVYICESLTVSKEALEILDGEVEWASWHE